MSIYLHSLRSGLASLVLPLAAAMLVCLVCMQGLPPTDLLGANRAAGYWLHLPGLLLAATALAAVLEHWPLFSRARRGGSFVLRVENRPLHGCLAASLGNLTALGLALVGAGVLFSTILTGLGLDQGPVHPRTRLELKSPHDHLNDEQPALRFAMSQNLVVDRIVVRPRAVFGGRIEAAQIRLSADGIALHEGSLKNAGDSIELQVVPARRIRELRIEREPGSGFVLRLQPGSVLGISATTYNSLWNCLLASLSYLFPAAIALTVMILGHRHLALPVNLAAGIVTCLLSTLTDITANGAVIAAFARGHWVVTEPIWLPALYSLAGAALLIGLRHGLGRFVGI